MYVEAIAWLSYDFLVSILLIGQFHLMYAPLYDTLLCQADIADCSHYTHLCMWTYV